MRQGGGGSEQHFKEEVPSGRRDTDTGGPRGQEQAWGPEKSREQMLSVNKSDLGSTGKEGLKTCA